MVCFWPRLAISGEWVVARLVEVGQHVTLYRKEEGVVLCAEIFGD